MLRKKLEEEFNIELLDKKQLIRQEIERFLAEQGGDDEEDDEEEADMDDTSNRKKGAARGSSLGCLLSEPLQKFLGEKKLPRTQVVKRLWDYIKANNLQDPRDKRKIMLDDKLKTIFTSPLTMFTMNTQLSKHCKTADAVAGDDDDDDGDDERPAKRAAPSSKSKEPKTKKAKGDGDGDGGEKKKQSGFTKPSRLAPELAEWTGKDAMARHEVVKFFWDYVKERNLQDPADKRQVLCDDTLKKLTGQDRMSGFAATKYFSKYFLKD